MSGSNLSLPGPIEMLLRFQDLRDVEGPGLPPSELWWTTFDGHIDPESMRCAVLILPDLLEETLLLVGAGRRLPIRLVAALLAASAYLDSKKSGGAR